jgi:hypothetical protein
VHWLNSAWVGLLPDPLVMQAAELVNRLSVLVVTSDDPELLGP